jgi:hypothetical protein
LGDPIIHEELDALEIEAVARSEEDRALGEIFRRPRGLSGISSKIRNA